VSVFPHPVSPTSPNVLFLMMPVYVLQGRRDAFVDWKLTVKPSDVSNSFMAIS